MAGSAIIPHTSTGSSTRTVNSKPRTRYSKSYQGRSRIQTVKKSGRAWNCIFQTAPREVLACRAPPISIETEVLDRFDRVLRFGDCGHVGNDGGHVGHDGGHVGHG